MFKTSNNKTTFEELELFDKHGGTFRDPTLNFDFKKDNKVFWSNISFGENFIISKEQLEAHIEFMRTSLQVRDTVEVSMQVGGILFPSGQSFENWIADKHMELSSIKQEEIIQ